LIIKGQGRLACDFAPKADKGRIAPVISLSQRIIASINIDIFNNISYLAIYPPRRGNPMTLTKLDIVQNVSDKLGLSKRDSSKIVESVFEVMKEQLSKGDTVKISGFGNFVVRNKRARKGRNPHTGSEMEISARTVLTFKSSPILKKTLNRKDI
jgi:integration host factor subunit alpha